MPRHTLVNGVASEQVSVRDRGLQYGDGVFETVAVCRGRALLWEAHLERLRLGCDRLAIPMPESGVLQDEAARLCTGVTKGVLKIILTRGTGGRGYASGDAGEPTRVLSRFPWPAYEPKWAETGVLARLCETRLARNPRLAGIKHLNRLEQVLARREWEDEVAEGVMRDEAGDVIEGVMSNLFVVSSGVLATPDLSYCGIAGVMRALVLEKAGAMGVPARIGRLTVDDLERCDELFFTNSIIGIWPVVRFENRYYRVGPMTRQLQGAISDAQCY